MLDFSIIVLLTTCMSAFVVTIPLMWKIVEVLLTKSDYKQCAPIMAFVCIICYMFIATLFTVWLIQDCAKIYGGI